MNFVVYVNKMRALLWMAFVSSSSLLFQFVAKWATYFTGRFCCDYELHSSSEWMSEIHNNARISEYHVTTAPMTFNSCRLGLACEIPARLLLRQCEKQQTNALLNVFQLSGQWNQATTSSRCPLEYLSIRVRFQASSSFSRYIRASFM